MPENGPLHLSENIGFEDGNHPNSQDNSCVVLLCRVILGDCCKIKRNTHLNVIIILYDYPFSLDIMGSNLPIEGEYYPTDIKTHPPVNPSTHKPYDSILYFYTNNNGKRFTRVAIYDMGQIYPEYCVKYVRIPG